MTNVYRAGLLFQTVLWKCFRAWEFLPAVSGYKVGFNCFWQNQKVSLIFSRDFWWLLKDLQWAHAFLRLPSGCSAEETRVLLAGAWLPPPWAFDLGATVISGGLTVPWELPFLLCPRAECAEVFFLVVCRSLVTERTLTLNYCASYLLFDVPPAHMFRIRLWSRDMGSCIHFCLAFPPILLHLKFGFPSSSLA